MSKNEYFHEKKRERAAKIWKNPDKLQMFTGIYFDFNTYTLLI